MAVTTKTKEDYQAATRFLRKLELSPLPLRTTIVREAIDAGEIPDAVYLLDLAKDKSVALSIATAAAQTSRLSLEEFSAFVGNFHSSWEKAVTNSYVELINHLFDRGEIDDALMTLNKVRETALTPAAVASIANHRGRLHPKDLPQIAVSDDEVRALLGCAELPKLIEPMLRIDNAHYALRIFKAALVQLPGGPRPKIDQLADAISEGLRSGSPTARAFLAFAITEPTNDQWYGEELTPGILQLLGVKHRSLAEQLDGARKEMNTYRDGERPIPFIDRLKQQFPFGLTKELLPGAPDSAV